MIVDKEIVIQLVYFVDMYQTCTRVRLQSKAIGLKLGFVGAQENRFCMFEVGWTKLTLNASFSFIQFKNYFTHLFSWF